MNTCFRMCAHAHTLIATTRCFILSQGTLDKYLKSEDSIQRNQMEYV